MSFKNTLIGMGVAISNITPCHAADFNGSAAVQTYLIDDFNLLGFLSSPYTNILGNYFYLMFGVIIEIMIFYKSQSVMIPIIIGVIFAAMFGSYLPESAGISILMLFATGIGAILFKIFKGGQ